MRVSPCTCFILLVVPKSTLQRLDLPPQRIVAVLLAVLSVLACAEPGKRIQAEVRIGGTRAASDPGSMTREELRDEVMRFSDRYTAWFSQFAAEAQRWAVTPEARVAISSRRLYAASSATDIAVGPNPVVNLLDMLVLTSLSRMVVEDGLRQEVPGFTMPSERREEKIVQLRGLESEIWRVAEEVLTRDQSQALRRLIGLWREEHPDWAFVEFVRLGDFAGEHGEEELALAFEGGLLPKVKLLPDVDEATRVARELTERSIFLAQRFPQLLRYQAEVFAYERAAQPELAALLASAERISEASERMASTFEQLPEEQERLQALSGDLRETILAGSELATRMTDTIAAVDAFMIGMSDRSSESDRPFDVRDYQQAAAEMTQTAQQFDVVLARVNEILASPAWDERLPQLMTTMDHAEAGTEAIVDRVFLRGVAMIAVFLVGSLLTALLYQWAKRAFFS